MAKTLPVAVLVLGLATAAMSASASSGTLSLELENDILGGSDRYYTNGLQLAWRSAAAGLPAPVGWLDRRLDWLLGPGAKRWGLALGHSIFTPADTSLREPDPRDRPYAGHLYGSLALSRSTGHSLSSFELQLGLVGPSALGKEVQNTFHRLLNTETYDGRGYQLKDEPVLTAIGARSWRAPLGRIAGGLEAELLPSGTLSLGSAQTYLGGGATLRIGQGLEADFGPPRIGPALAGSVFFEPEGEDGPGWYAFAGAEGRARHLPRRQYVAGEPVRRPPRTGGRPSGRARLALGAAPPRLYSCLAQRGVLRPTRRGTAIRLAEPVTALLTA